MWGKSLILITGGTVLLSYGQTKNFAPHYAVSDNYHGRSIIDEYRNLENLQDSAVVNWIIYQSKSADSNLNSIPNNKFYLEKRLELEGRKGYAISDLRITADNIYFYLKRNAGETLSKVYFRNGFNDTEQLLYDPIHYRSPYQTVGDSSKHEFVINLISPSWDGSKVAVSLSEKGKEISEIIVVDVKSKKVLPDIITQANPASIGGIKWLPDNSGFFYVYYPVTDGKSKLFAKNTKTILYTIGSNPDNRNDVFSNSSNPELIIPEEKYPVVLAFNQDDQYYIGILVDAEDYRQTFIIKKDDLLSGRKNWKPLYGKDDKVTNIRLEGSDLYFLSGNNAANLKLCRTKIEAPDFRNPEVLIPEKKNEVINQYTITKDGLYYTTIKNGIESKIYFVKNGIEKELELSYVSGSIDLQSKSRYYSDIWINCSGWTSEEKRFKYNPQNNSFTMENMAPPTEYPEFKDIIAEVVTVKSHDGEEVPLTLIYDKNLKKNGKAPTLIYGYGAFSEVIRPMFAKAYLLWAMQGGVFAIAHVRGGGEKGERWHQEGKKDKKPNSWKDLIACTEYLIANKFSSSETIAVWGQSGGGIVAGRSITERPDLFKAAIIESGNLNTIRAKFHGVGGTSVAEYGDIDNPDEFPAVLKMDSYQSLQKGKNYPSTLLMTGMNDTRIAPWQSVKFAAKMQAFTGSSNPVLLKVDMDSGHGIEDPVYKIHQRNSLIFAYAFWQLGHPDYQPKTENKK